MNEAPDSISASASAPFDSPWLGLLPFTEHDWRLFFGRDTDVDALQRLVFRETATTLFGQSGLGKTSLLRAGLFPRLRRLDLLPVYIRLDYSPHAAPLSMQPINALANAVRANRIDVPEPAPSEDLWSYLHRKDVDFFLPNSRLATPVLVFDQFEELFTLGQSSRELRSRTETFLLDLGNLIENRIPDMLRQSMVAWSDEEIKRFDLRAVRYKVLLSLREDFLPELDMFLKRVPSLAHNRMRIQRMTGAQALEVVLGAGRDLVEPVVAERIVRFVGGASDPRRSASSVPDGNGTRGGQPSDEGADPLEALQVEPALLSIFCRELDLRRQQHRLAKVTIELLRVNRSRILADFYQRSLSGVSDGARTLIEERLLTRGGYRSSIALDDALAEPGVTEAVVDLLINRRLLRADHRSGQPRLELAHDLLAQPVRMSRDQRHQEQELAAANAREEAARTDAAAANRRERASAERLRRERRQKLLSIGLAIVAIITTIAALWQLKISRQLTGEAIEAKKLEASAKKEAVLESAKANNTLAKVMREHGGAAFLESQYDEAALYLAAAGNLNPQLLSLDDEDNASLRYQLIQSLQEWTQRASNRPELTLVGAHGPITQIQFAGSVERLVTGGADGALRVWDCSTGKSSVLYDPRNGPVSSLALALSSHGRVLVGYAGSAAAFVSVLDRDSRPLQGHVERITTAAFSPDGRLAATGSLDGSARLWVTDTADCRITFPAFPNHGGIRFLDVADSGAMLTIDTDGTAELLTSTPHRNHRELVKNSIAGWFVEQGQQALLILQTGEARLVAVSDGTTRPVHQLTADSRRPIVVATDPARTHIAVAHSDGSVAIWDMSFKKLAEFDRCGDVRAMTFSADGSTLAIVSADAGLTIGSVAMDRIVDTRDIHGAACAAFAPDNQTVAVGDENGTVRICEIHSRVGPIEKKLPASSPVDAVAFSVDGAHAITAGHAGTASVWNTRDWKQQFTLTHGEEGTWILGAAFSPDGQFIVTAGGDLVRVWNAANGQMIREFRDPRFRFTAAEFTADGQYVVAARHQEGIEVNAPPQRPLVLLPLNGPAKLIEGAEYHSDLTSLALSSDRRYVLAMGNGNCAVWRSQGLDPPWMPWRGAGISACAFAPDNLHYAVGRYDGTATIYDLTSGVICQLATSGQPSARSGGDASPKAAASDLSISRRVNAIAFEPGGKRVAVAIADGRIAICNAHSGVVKAVIHYRGGEPTRMLFGPRGDLLIVADAAGNLSVWDGSNGEKAIEAWPAHRGPVRSIACDPTGRRFVSCGDGGAKVWRLPISDATAQELIADVVPVAQVMRQQRQRPLDSDWLLERAFEEVAPDLKPSMASAADLYSAALRDLKDRKYQAASEAIAKAYALSGGPNAAPAVRFLAAATLHRLDGLSWATQAHQDRISQVAFSPDATRIVTGGWDGKARLFEASSGRLIADCPSSGGGMTYQVTFSPDGAFLVAAGDRTQADVFDGHTGAFRWKLPQRSRVVAIDFNPDSSALLIAARNGTLSVWSLADGAQRLSFAAVSGESRIWDAFFVDHGRMILAIAGGKAMLWDSTTGTPIGELNSPDATLPEHPASDVTRDTTIAAIERQDHSIGIYDVAARKLLYVLRGNAASINAVRFDPSGNRVAATDHNAITCVWNLPASPAGNNALARTRPTGEADHAATVPAPEAPLSPVVKFAQPVEDARELEFNQDGSRIMTCHTQGFVWNAATGDLLATFRTDSGIWSTAALSPDGSRVATGSSSGLLQCWNVIDAQAAGAQPTLAKLSAAAMTADLSSDGTWGLIATQEGTFWIDWTTANRQPPMPLKLDAGDSIPVQVACLPSTGQRRIALLVTPAEAVVIEIPSGKRLRSTVTDKGEPRTTGPTSAPVPGAIAISPNRQWLARVGDGGIQLWRLPDLTTISGLEHIKTNSSTRLKFSQSGKSLLAYDADGYVAGWDLRERRPFFGEPRETAIWDADVIEPRDSMNRLIVTCGQEQSIRISSAMPEPSINQVAPATTAATPSLATKRAKDAERSELVGHRAAVRNVIVSADAARLLSVSEDGTCRLWDLRNRTPLATFGETWDVAERAWFTADGGLAFIAAKSGKISVVDSATGEIIDQLDGPPGEITAAAADASGSDLLTADTDVNTLVIFWPKLLENRPAERIRDEINRNMAKFITSGQQR